MLQIRRRSRLPGLVAAAALSAVACGGGEEVVVMGPGLIPVRSPGALSVGGATLVEMGWAAAGAAPALRLRWAVGDPSVVRIDSVSADTRTAYLRGRTKGQTSVSVTDAQQPGRVEFTLTVQ